MARVARGTLHGVDARVATAPAGPGLPLRVAVDAIHRAPRRAPVLAAEQARRLRPAVHHAGLALVSRGDAPYVLDGDAHVLGKSQALAAPVPVLAQVRALGH